MKGYVTEVKLDKGFGFVRGTDGISRFAHASQFLPRSWFDLAKEGDRVEFESAPGRPGKGSELRAINIRQL